MTLYFFSELFYGPFNDIFFLELLSADATSMRCAMMPIRFILNDAEARI